MIKRPSPSPVQTVGGRHVCPCWRPPPFGHGPGVRKLAAVSARQPPHRASPPRRDAQTLSRFQSSLSCSAAPPSEARACLLSFLRLGLAELVGQLRSGVGRFAGWNSKGLCLTNFAMFGLDVGQSVSCCNRSSGWQPEKFTGQTREDEIDKRCRQRTSQDGGVGRSACPTELGELEPRARGPAARPGAGRRVPIFS